MTLRALSGLLALALVLAACGTPDRAAAPGTIPVVASTDVYGSVVQAVGGDRVTVTSLISDPAVDPHSYEAPPAAAAVARARLVVVNGGGYDDFAERLTPGPGAAVIDVVALSGLTAPAGGELNEHVWYSLPTMKKLAGQIATDLGAADPSGAAQFTANATAFEARMDGLIGQVEALKAAHAGARIAVTEPVPLYLTDAAGLVDVTPPQFSEAVEEDADPPAAVVAATLEEFTADPVRALLVNTQTRTPVTDQVEKAARTAGVPIVEVGETLPAGTTDYVEWIKGQLDALRAALDRP
ncbi:MAG TPA: zinc ABC transporter substrate-binding protein [Pseudonocardia sp.]|nr:zinc ABC transporter substrate-binding protein [Pseudonocardia sp.]